MFISIIVACFVSVFSIAAMLHMKRFLPLDHPNQRSLHERPIPRIGGVAILLGAGSGIALLSPTGALLMALTMAYVLGAISLIDDFRSLSVLSRFGAQVLVAVMLVWYDTALPGGAMGVFLAIFWLLWMSNLYNFMDGSNGLAGGMAVSGFGFYALAAFVKGDFNFAIVTASVASASLAFLWFNFDPAKIFMGDVGSIPLGFLAAAFGLEGWQSGLWPMAFPLIIFSPFIFDASVTLTKRLLRGGKIWQPHKEHYYQRLVRMGLGHRWTALLEYVLMFASGLCALFSLDTSAIAQFYLLASLSLLYGILFYVVDRAWVKHQKEFPSS